MNRTVLRSKAMREKLGGVSQTTFWRLRQDRTFPKPIELSGQPAWFEDETDTWLESQPRYTVEAPSEALEARERNRQGA